MTKWRGNLLLQFSIVCLPLLIVVIFLTGWWLRVNTQNLVLDEAANEAVDTASRHIIRGLRADDFQEPFVGERYDEFNTFIQQYVASDRIARVKLWDTQGQVLFSTNKAQVGRTSPIDEELANALRGQIGREITTPASAETEEDRALGTLMSVYVPIRMPGSAEIVGVFEIYQYYAPFEYYIKLHNRNLLFGMTAGGIVLYLVLWLIVRRGWHTILSQRRDIDMRLREVQGLNNLFQQYLTERDNMIEAIRHLSDQEVIPETLSREQLDREYIRLKAETQRLTAQVIRPHLLESPERNGQG